MAENPTHFTSIFSNSSPSVHHALPYRLLNVSLCRTPVTIYSSQVLLPSHSPHGNSILDFNLLSSANFRFLRQYCQPSLSASGSKASLYLHPSGIPRKIIVISQNFYSLSPDSPPSNLLRLSQNLLSQLFCPLFLVSGNLFDIPGDNP